MTNFLVGLDFGTSQTKVCIYNETFDTREFVKFANGDYFLPTVIVYNSVKDKFYYGDESVEGVVFRYFKMAAAEDDDLIQSTYEDLNGVLTNQFSDYKKYSSDTQIKAEILVVLYLTYVYLFVRDSKKSLANGNRPLGSRLASLLGGRSESSNHDFKINLGYPTEWNSPKLLKRKVKFESLLMVSRKLADDFTHLSDFTNRGKLSLIERIDDISSNFSKEFSVNSTTSSRIEEELYRRGLSVFPESAAGVNYLLQTKRLTDGIYTTLDIGGGTSDIAMFEVRNNELKCYYCSESVSIASNDFYRQYALCRNAESDVGYDKIREIELIVNNQELNSNYFEICRKIVRGDLNNSGIEFAIRKMFYRRFYLPLHQKEESRQFAIKTLSEVHGRPIILLGGGSNLKVFKGGRYCFFLNFGNLLNGDRALLAKSITDYVPSLNIGDNNQDLNSKKSLLVLALGLTYGNQNFNNFQLSDLNFERPLIDEMREDVRYYDLFYDSYK